MDINNEVKQDQANSVNSAEGENKALVKAHLNSLSVNTSTLDAESLNLLNKIIAEVDVEKTKDLTYLFNQNQNKKTMVRINKLSELLDVITDQAIIRFTVRPDEISNKELLDGLKTVQDLVERGQKQVVGTAESPLIQINQQTNEVKVGDTGISLNHESRERVKNAVLSLINGLASQQVQTESTIEQAEVIDDNEIGD